MFRFAKIFILCLLVLSILTACSTSSPKLTVENAYGKFSPTVAGAGGLFMLIKNSSNVSDRLVSGTSPACGMVEIHEMVKKADGTMGMNMVTEPVEVLANGSLELKEGGMHIMCMMVNQDLFKLGSKIDLTLLFEKSGEQKISVEIKE